MTGGRIYAPGAIANDFGDIYGMTPRQVIQFGKLITEDCRVPEAVRCGWEIEPGGENGHTRLARTSEQRTAHWNSSHIHKS